MKVNYKIIKIIAVILCSIPIIGLGQGFSSRQVSYGHSWGLVFSGDLGLFWANTIKGQLYGTNGLKSLSPQNPNGWGLSFYVRPDGYLSTIPMSTKAGTLAVDDPRYNGAVDEMIACCDDACLAHIRKINGDNNDDGEGYQPATFMYPNPNPFRRYGLYRDFDMFFAHTGKIDHFALLSLIGTYGDADSNCPDYYNSTGDDSYYNSDLYAIYVMREIDWYPGTSIDECVNDAVYRLASTLQFAGKSRELNFIMTDGYTMWVIRYSDSQKPMYYYDVDNPYSTKWAVASAQLGPSHPVYGWVSIANQKMAKFVPGQSPVISTIHPPGPMPLSVNTENSHDAPVIHGIELFPNPCKGQLNIQFSMQKTGYVEVKLYNACGRMVDDVYSATHQPGVHEISYATSEFPDGVYFVRVQGEGEVATRKVIFQR
jgi:predicted glutamine amidotransferase